MAQEMAKTARDVAAPRESGETTRARPLFRPLADIYETENGVVVIAEMPGVSPEDVDITLERRVLTIRGRAPDFAHEGYRKIYAEYEDGDYERVFTVSEEIDQDQIKASHKDGVLTVELPKAGPAKAKKIAVKSS
jgi:HSP20 family protein